MDTAGSNEPKKYIRTYEGDMEALKKGDIPNLAPLDEKPAPTPTPPAPEPIEEKEPIVEAPAPPPPPKPAPPPPPPPPPEPPPPPPAPRESGPHIVLPPIMRQVPPAPSAEKVIPLKTYAGDFRDRVKDTSASKASILAAEQDAKKGAPVESPHVAPHYSIPLVAGGAILLILTGIGAYAAYSHYVSVTGPVVIAPGITAPIFVDDREMVMGTSTKLFQKLETSLNRPLASGSVRLLYFLPASSTQSVFAALQTPAPDILVRNIHTEGSMAGVITVSGTQSFFFILSVSSYSNTFSGMLTWEPIMRRDLARLFPAHSATTNTVVAASSATSTSQGAGSKVSPLAPIPALVFTDDVIANHDVRIYRDIAGRSVIVYGYWNPSTLVIARDPAAFTELIQRLATRRTP